ncbi:oxygenase MpaB family protein [Natronolimnohabitans innermongolicus]|uniref:ER-bound oxygenase mpaB/mpaB'/Rubber oxygenase catalytic domain-containing protein n=1 Tax=Natronolimnohabitans innermongolicus JCM 12255 TaxID=1227499 RepID=L9XH84_9EURY|nr:oxygenase MpaB family protein [Natronolimnohabitans innermongolicus]ELY61099.1 hypothetical protein C493_03235 [Natronolimnohabitans innermongolicus JCM 12255]
MDRFEPDDTALAGPNAIPPDIAALVDETDAPARGFFGPDSVMWTVSRERALLFNGVATILLQLAHPQVAAGVAEHSDFEADPLGRFRRTFELVHAVIFGDIQTAVEAALTVRAIHAGVTGTRDETVGSFAVGDRYAAVDPELLLWVHATLIAQSLAAYETYVTTLSETAREAYYRDCTVFGQLFGVSAAQYPETLADFTDYFERTVTEDLAVGTRGDDLRRALFRQGRVLKPLYAILGVGPLPDPVRTAYGLPWTARRQRAFDAWTALAGTVVPSLPGRLRYVPAYRRACARIQRRERDA